MNEAIVTPPSARATASGSPAWHSIRPLTRARKDSGEAYTREGSVVAQITRLGGMTNAERQRALTVIYDGKDPLRPKEETIVYFVREYDRRGDKNAAWRLLETLLSRIPGHVGRELAKWRLPESEQNECMEALVVEMYEAILSHEPRQEFWEVRFWVCLDRRIHAHAEKMQRVRDREVRPADDFGAEEDSAHGAEGIFATLADTHASPEVIALRKDLQARLSETEWQAVFLKYIEKIPEESGDADKVTIAKILGVTGRSVRNYLRRAEKKLLDA
ncbi:MAG: sigma-70 family RNA polymerase sigma factor [Fibrella sp.]|nr:sigma-70 family RNA polymerase sigma factor [Armatimonadota bacterium]